MRLLAYLHLLCQSGALFTIPPADQIYDVITTPLVPITGTVTLAVIPTTVTKPKKLHTFPRTKTESSQSTSITMAPLSRNALELRQKYMNDQGLGVDCGTWTKYQYTRVIPNDEAMKGDSNSTSSSVKPYTSAGADSIMPLAITYIVLMNVITLWAAMSLA